MKGVGRKFAMLGKAYKHECGSRYYDHIYSISDEYKKDYSSSYYINVYNETCNILKHKNIVSLLECGCGCGVFASMIAACLNNITYIGFDFSDVAISMAKKRVPEYIFIKDNIYTTKIFDTVEYDAVVCHEVLEHLQDDLCIFKKIKPNTLFIGSVPSFDDVSHVRFFLDESSVIYRYGRLLNIEHIFSVDRIYLFYGIIKDSNKIVR